MSASRVATIAFLLLALALGTTGYLTLQDSAGFSGNLFSEGAGIAASAALALYVLERVAAARRAEEWAHINDAVLRSVEAFCQQVALELYFGIPAANGARAARDFPGTRPFGDHPEIMRRASAQLAALGGRPSHTSTVRLRAADHRDAQPADLPRLPWVARRLGLQALIPEPPPTHAAVAMSIKLSGNLIAAMERARGVMLPVVRTFGDDLALLSVLVSLDTVVGELEYRLGLVENDEEVEHALWADIATVGRAAADLAALVVERRAAARQRGRSRLGHPVHDRL